MIDYSLRQIFLEGLERYYLPLPKLNESQVELLVSRLEGSGFRVNVGGTIRAKSGERALTIERSGLAWSNMDLLDPLAPVIPSLLGAQKNEASENPYFVAKRTGGKYTIQLFMRMEALNIWKELRKHDVSGLTPDELAVISSLLEGSRGKILGVTDYPREQSRVIQFGTKVYHESMIDVEEFIANLRTVEKKNRRNSYLPRNSILEFQLSRALSARRTAKIIASLGQWCYLLL
jgi:hypothetical protein